MARVFVENRIKKIGNSMEMEFFYEIYEQVLRQGPGTDEATARAFSLVPSLPPEARLLDVGCGAGSQTLALTELFPGEVVAVDNHQPFLDALKSQIAQRGLGERMVPILASMFDLPFAEGSFDLIWSEGAVYIMGFTEGLRAWRPLLKPGGCVAVSELVWLKDSPPKEVCAYWEEQGVQMKSIDTKLQEARAAGYRILGHFTLPARGWEENYYRPLEQVIPPFRQKYADEDVAQTVCDVLEEEIRIYRGYGTFYGYEFFVMQKG